MIYGNSLNSLPFEQRAPIMLESCLMEADKVSIKTGDDFVVNMLTANFYRSYALIKNEQTIKKCYKENDLEPLVEALDELLKAFEKVSAKGAVHKYFHNWSVTLELFILDLVYYHAALYGEMKPGYDKILDPSGRLLRKILNNPDVDTKRLIKIGIGTRLNDAKKRLRKYESKGDQERVKRLQQVIKVDQKYLDICNELGV